MTNFVVDKTAITKKVLSILDMGDDQDTYDHVYKLWWKNIRQNGGLCLTEIGDSAFRKAGLEYYDIDCSNRKGPIPSDILLKMDKYLLCPYIPILVKKDRFLRVYDSRVAVMIGIHGHLIEYLNSLSVKRTELTK